MAPHSVQQPLERRLDPQEFIWATGVIFRGLTISQKAGRWNVILRGTRRGGQHVYSMLSVEEDPFGALHTLIDALEKKGGEALWSPDKFA